MISCNPDVMGGAPVFSGTRVPVQTVLDYLEAGETIDDFLEGFPTVTREQVIALLEEAKDLLVVRRRVDELDAGVVQAIPWPEVKKRLYRGFEASDETAYLLRSPTNEKRLLESIADLERGLGMERELIE